MTEGPDRRAPNAMEVLDGSGESCATFTPVVAAHMRKLSPGSVMAVISDDETAPEALASWARLSGNELLGTHEEASGRRRFVLRRRQ